MSLLSNIEKVTSLPESQSGSIVIEKSYFDPSFWVLFLSQRRGISNIKFEWEQNRSFANTIGLLDFINPRQSVTVNRHSEGKKYSRIQRIESDDPASVNLANTGINTCMRKVLQDFPFLLVSQSATGLFQTVMELHDNVASHSESIGYSFFQLRDKDLFYCISDSGKGFLSEIRSHNIPGIMSHQDAIDWSLKKGNSTKKVEDEFAQMLPEDAFFNPMGGTNTFRRKADGNHHMGIGLDILKSFCLDSGGILEVATGDSIYILNSQGEEKFINGPKIVGVTISMSINLSLAKAKLEKLVNLPNILPSIKWEVSHE
ncbi:hypothetical protein [Leptospira jelokensis]|uniref:hypothetical protein n=1 Tax=Leptospira jelokensis TaxID=2484931 RepID=UPI001090FDC7|nr:hypothetical protein [Leptospira jelokensis]TGL97950.1 hypothetical protein EHQ79_19070 [Leptospira jelokensis]